jgi:hypothetical protein
MSNHKTIKINPELFSLTKQKKTKPDASEAKTKKNTTFKPNNIKNKLLERIKAHKNKEANLGSSSTHSHATDFEAQSDEFNDSMAYLSSLAKKSKETTDRDAYVQNTQGAMTGGKSKTLKNYASAPSPSLHVELELPEGLKESPMVFYAPVPPANEPPMTLSPPNANYIVDNKVPYGCLKGGVKPTFKTWNKTQRQQPSVAQPSLNINTSSLGGSSNTTLRETKMKELKEKMRRKQQTLDVAQPPSVAPTPFPKPAPTPQAQPEPERTMNIPVAPLIQEAQVMIMTDTDPANQTTFAVVPTTQNAHTNGGGSKRIKKTIKRTYTLGKSKIHKRVGVLIKDKNTRKRVLNAQRDIKRHGINDIKQYLRTHGLMKAGSSAPNDIIRKIYESAMLSGEVTNQDKDILLQNFLKEKDA